MESFLLFLCLFYGSHAIIYENYYGTPCTSEILSRYEKANTTSKCTTDIEPCDPDEWRRVQGSCNNLDHPTYGAARTPYYRVLPSVYSAGLKPGKSVRGNDLPLPRKVRTDIFPQGSVTSSELTVMFTHCLVFVLSDITSNHDTMKYLFEKTDCCSEEGKNDHECITNKVPDDDPVLRFSGIGCLNMTRPDSFQSHGCTRDNTTFSRIAYNTPLYDLASLYGVSETRLNDFRTFEGGFLKTEMENGKIWPPSTTTEENSCVLNNGPTETRCHDCPNTACNSLLGVNMFTVFFWRQHNHIAKELQKINPCWDDQKLFYTARDINIAIFMQIYIYEMLQVIVDKELLIKDNIMVADNGYREVYNSSLTPQMSLEYQYLLRWAHTLLQGKVRMYDTDGSYMKEVDIGNMTFKTGYVAENIVYITHGALWQGSAKPDYIVDPIISNVGLGSLQKSLDILTNDIAKSRYFGFQPYVKYREHCFGDSITRWEDLEGIIHSERAEALRNLYEYVEDIELYVGMSMENFLANSSISPLLYAIMKEHLLKMFASDRHWYERKYRPYAFTEPQLSEIRKVTVARLLCDVGDSVSKIQPNAFKRIGPNNKMVDCSEIKQIDYSAWKDSTCAEKKPTQPAQQPTKKKQQSDETTTC